MKNKNKISLEKFIAGAEKDDRIKKSRKRVNTESVLLSVTGKMSNTRSYSSVVFYLTPDIEEDIDEYCAGSKQGILSYLVRRGLDDLIKEKKLIIHDFTS